MKRQIAARHDRAEEVERKAGPEADLEGDSDEARAFRELENETASLIREREHLKIKRRGGISPREEIWKLACPRGRETSRPIADSTVL